MYTNDVTGWMRPVELDWLYTQARRMSSIVELGSFRGKSTVAFLDGCRGTVYAVDLFDDEHFGLYPDNTKSENSMMHDFLKNTGNAPNLKVIKTYTVLAACMVPSVDMVFIDSSHEYLQTLAELQAWNPKALKLICGHDYMHGAAEVKRAVDGFFGFEPARVQDIWYVEK